MANGLTTNSISQTDGDGARSVLVVEDHDDTRRFMQRLLETMGYKPVLAADGPSGVDAALTHRPAVALVDLGLPDGMDGFEVARRLRSEIGPNIRLVALTGHGQPENVHQATEAGFDRHLLKPVHPDHLIQILTEVLGPPTDGKASGGNR